MTCNQCGVALPDDAAFCHKCGAPVGKPAGAPTGKQRLAAALAGGHDDDDPEQVVWQGRYSPRAMFGTWLTAGVLTIALVVLGFVAKFSSIAWLGVAGLLAVVWIGLLLALLYKQISVHYYLTDQRLLHERGLLWREIDRIEAIDIDDVTFRQGPVERMLGVGTVHITSSDATTPKFAIVGIENVRQVATTIDEIRRKERRRRGLHIESV